MRIYQDDVLNPHTGEIRRMTKLYTEWAYTHGYLCVDFAEKRAYWAYFDIDRNLMITEREIPIESVRDAIEEMERITTAEEALNQAFHYSHESSDESAYRNTILRLQKENAYLVREATRDKRD